MPVVAQINVNFANLQEVRNVDEFDIASGGDFQIEDKCINPNILTKYCLYNREYGDAGDYGLSDVDYLRYIGGYISAGNKVNVKHSDLHVRNNLHVGDNLYAEYIYSRFYNKTDGDYQDERAKNPRFITLSPKIEDKFTTYLTIETTDANTRFIDLHAQRSTTPNKIRIDSNATTDKIEVISPIINLFKGGATNGVVNINSFLNVANDTKINTNKFVVTASDGKTQVAGNLNVGSNTEYSKFTVDSSTGNTVVEGTLAVTGNTTLKNNVIFEGGSSQTFVINNGTTGADKFTVDSTNGNTVIQGTLNVIGTATIKNSLTLEGGASKSFVINTGPSGTNKFTVDSTNGNTDIQGTLNIKGNTLINSDKFVVTASDGKTQIAGDLNIGSVTTGAGAYGKFTVSSSSGNTDINGTLNLENILTMDGAGTAKRITGVHRKTTYDGTGNFNDTGYATDALTIGDFLQYREPVNVSTGGQKIYNEINTTTGKPEFYSIAGKNNITVSFNATSKLIEIAGPMNFALFLDLAGVAAPSVDAYILSIVGSVYPVGNFVDGTTVRVYYTQQSITSTGAYDFRYTFRAGGGTATPSAPTGSIRVIGNASRNFVTSVGSVTIAGAELTGTSVTGPTFSLQWNTGSVKTVTRTGGAWV